MLILLAALNNSLAPAPSAGNATSTRVFFHVQLAPANQAYYDFTTLNVPIP